MRRSFGGGGGHRTKRRIRERDREGREDKT
jgi:hypothetical protein